MHGWPIEEFIKASLKNKHAYAHKCGFAESSHDRANKSSNEDNEDEYNPVHEDSSNENKGDENGSGDEDGPGDEDDEWR